ncbi:hypothetical protein [Leucobacter ruminantium]|uniref:Uncharacterized protein n=1 Tax=Leucobacter ruminantium TaxID=1289170 RepID=A0A939LYI3_9MICO|nr:hypothetical protein [Leucobacter ruminantium]MBO1806461.1 hypothetical protein [Leucobacter ruminantium]
MSKREEIRAHVLNALATKLGDVVSTSSELSLVYEFSGEVDGRPLRVVVKQFPAGENPETYGGREKWSVELFGEDGELDRFHNPEDSLELAFDMVNWDKVKDYFVK